MSKVVVLTIGRGNFEQGFPIDLQIREAQKPPHRHNTNYSLPPAAEIPNLYQNWQDIYYRLGKMRLDFPDYEIDRVAIDEEWERAIQTCEDAAQALKTAMKKWLNQPSMLRLLMEVQQEVKPNESARVILQTEDIQLRRLPWHLWELFRCRPRAEMAISARCAPQSAPLKRPVKILAILGGDKNINLEQDKTSLEQLPGAKVKFLVKPSQEQLNDELWEKPWDILFFAGHSFSNEKGNNGVIKINDTDWLSLSQLRYALLHALHNGLKLAIFNSCKGLGLASQLADLEVPHMIVMREPVPDLVAQTFLRYFLDSFAKGKSFYSAVREARERLERMEHNHPCATWLPIICQNSAEPELRWPKSLLGWLWGAICQSWESKVFRVGLIIGGITITITFTITELHNKTISKKQQQTPSLKTTSVKTDDISLSQGGKLLIPNNTTAEKEEGIRAFAEQQFSTAIKHFRSSLRQNPNDPETLIYLNNAIAEQNATTGTGKKLEIAVTVPIGEDSNVAQEILRGVAQAQSQLNCGIEEIQQAVAQIQSQLDCSGGIEDKLLQVTIADDKDEPDIAEQVANDFAEDPDILGVIGHYSSDATQQAGRVYKNKELVAISPISTSVNLSDSSDYFFRTTPNDATAAKDLANYMFNQFGPVEAAIAYVPGNEYSESLKKQFQKLLPSQEFAYECDLSVRGSFNALNCVSQTENQGAEVLLLAPGTKNTLDKALQVVNSNDGRLRLLGGDAMYNQRTLGYGEEAAEGEMVIAVPWHVESNHDPDFLQGAEELWKLEDVTWRTATAYDATQALIEGLKNLSGSPNRNKLQQELSRNDFSAKGATGKVEFDSSGDRKLFTGIGVLVQVQPDPDSETGYKFELLEQPSRE